MENNLFNDALHYPLLTAEEERLLLEKTFNNDLEARQLLINSNIRLVYSVANKYNGFGLPFDDLVQEGCIGLIKAIDHFKLDRGTKLSTYATYCIDSTICSAIKSKVRLIRVPEYFENKIIRVEKYIKEYYSFYGVNPSIEQISNDLDICLDNVNFILSEYYNVRSLNEEIKNKKTSESTELLDLIPAKEYDFELNLTRKTYVDDAGQVKDLENDDISIYKEDEDLLVTLRKGDLSEREELIFRLRFGFDNAKTLELKKKYHLNDLKNDIVSLEDISNVFGITCERVRQIQRKIEIKIRRYFLAERARTNRIKKRVCEPVKSSYK